jgi:Domain of unknown function (DUF4410)
MRIVKGLAGITLICLLGACASSVQRSDSTSNYVYSGEKFQSVEVVLSEKGKKELADNLKFDPAELQLQIARLMEAKGLIQDPSENRVRVEITDIRIRGTFVAIMIGIFAGADYVNGKVSVLDSSGRPKHEFVSKASWALGGWGGGQDTARLTWIYEKFAEVTVDEIMGVRKDKAKK